MNQLNITLFERTIYVFKKIDPAKKFSQFTYQEIEFKDVNVGDCKRHEILKIDGEYYQYSTEKCFNTTDPATKSKIQFKHCSKVIYECFA